MKTNYLDFYKKDKNKSIDTSFIDISGNKIPKTIH